MSAEGAKLLGEGVWGKLKLLQSLAWASEASPSLLLFPPGDAEQWELGSQHTALAGERAGELHGAPT